MVATGVLMKISHSSNQYQILHTLHGALSHHVLISVKADDCGRGQLRTRKTQDAGP
jgi:hypothetical protein